MYKKQVQAKGNKSQNNNTNFFRRILNRKEPKDISSVLILSRIYISDTYRVYMHFICRMNFKE